MKQKAYLILSILAICLYCSSDLGTGNNEPGNDPSNNEPPGNDPNSNEPPGNVIASGASVKDSNGRNLGVLLSGYSSFLSILTSNHYVVSYNWDGSIWKSQVFFYYYSELNCMGEVFPWFSFFQRIGGNTDHAPPPVHLIKARHDSEAYTLYTPINHGIRPGVFLYQSSYRSTSECINRTSVQGPGTINQVSAYYHLEPITREAAGIPETVDGPLRIE